MHCMLKALVSYKLRQVVLQFVANEMHTVHLFGI